jgi:hypothetical protein
VSKKKKRKREKKELSNSASAPPALSACLDGIPSLKPIKS